jgi:IclR family transcriptional regulator, KDG regulon repressor
MAGPTLINSLARGVQILRLLAAQASGLGVTEVAEQLHVDPSTAYRLLSTLEAHGFVTQDEASKKYSLGYGILEVTSGLLRRLSVVEVSQPHLYTVATTLGESAHVAVRDRKYAISVGSESASGVLRVETILGTPEPLYCTAVGKALLLDASREQLVELFGEQKFERHTPHTLTTIDELELDLTRARRLGYAFDDEELHPGVRCIAAPVRDYSGRIIAAFGISSPAIRLTRDHAEVLALEICNHAQAISAQLGYARSRTAAAP